MCVDVWVYDKTFLPRAARQSIVPVVLARPCLPLGARKYPSYSFREISEGILSAHQAIDCIACSGDVNASAGSAVIGD